MLTGVGICIGYMGVNLCSKVSLSGIFFFLEEGNRVVTGLELLHSAEE